MIGISTPLHAQSSTLHAGNPRSSILHLLSFCLASLALIETIILVTTPLLPVNEATLAIARHWLIPPKAVPDLDWLANNLGAPASRRRVSTPSGASKKPAPKALKPSPSPPSAPSASPPASTPPATPKSSLMANGNPRSADFQSAGSAQVAELAELAEVAELAGVAEVAVARPAFVV